MTEVSTAGSESVTDKVVLVGDVGVGKTSIFLRFKTGKFQETSPSHNPRDGEWRREWQVAGSNVSVGLSYSIDILLPLYVCRSSYCRCSTWASGVTCSWLALCSKLCALYVHRHIHFCTTLADRVA